MIHLDTNFLVDLVTINSTGSLIKPTVVCASTTIDYKSNKFERI